MMRRIGLMTEALELCLEVLQLPRMKLSTNRE
jgi:hypothetical protein